MLRLLDFGSARFDVSKSVKQDPQKRAQATEPSGSLGDSGHPVSSRGLIRGVSKVASGTLLSRMMGAVRDAVLAATFSVGFTDLFFVAFTIPNSLRVLLGEGAMSAAFVPVFTEVKNQQGEKEARRYFENMLGVMLLILLGVTLMGIALAPWLVALYAGGWKGTADKFENTVWLTRLVFPYIFLMGFSAVMTGALHGYKKFLVPAFAPIWLNVSLIVSCFVLVPWLEAEGFVPIAALGIGALVGGMLHVVTLFFPLQRLGLLRLPRFDFRHPKVRETLSRMVPLLAGLGVYQLNVMLSRLLASFLPEGSQSYLYYGQRLVEIPQGMFALAIATVSLPSITEQRSQGDEGGARETFKEAFRLTLLVAMPATVLLFILAEPIVTLYLGRGAFGSVQIVETVRSLRYLALGVWIVALVRVFVPLFHAMGDTKKPVMASAMNVIVFVGSSVFFMEELQHAAIALGMTLGATVQLGVLFFLALQKGKMIRMKELLHEALPVIACSALFAVSLAGLKFVFEPLISEKPYYFVALGLFCGVSTFIFVASAKILHIKEAMKFFQWIKPSERSLRR